jgi:hypothetical protein
MLNSLIKVDIVAVCDFNVINYSTCLGPSNDNGYMPKPHIYTNFDEFIQDDFEVVILLNSAH